MVTVEKIIKKYKRSDEAQRLESAFLSHKEEAQTKALELLETFQQKLHDVIIDTEWRRIEGEVDAEIKKERAERIEDAGVFLYATIEVELHKKNTGVFYRKLSVLTNAA